MKKLTSEGISVRGGIMSLFEHEARQFKFDVMREVSKRAFKGKLSVDKIDDIDNFLIKKKKEEFI